MLGISIIFLKWEKLLLKSDFEKINWIFKQSKLKYEICIYDQKLTKRTVNKLKKLASVYPLKVYSKKSSKETKLKTLLGSGLIRYENIIFLKDFRLEAFSSIPELAENINVETDIAISSNLVKHNYNESRLKKNIRLFLYEKILDVPSNLINGLIVYKKSKLELLEIKLPYPENCNLELMYYCRNAGFKYKLTETVIYQSNFVKQDTSFWQECLSILQIRFNPAVPIQIRPQLKKNMKGAGLRHNGLVYYTHTTMNHAQTAIQTLSTRQQLWLVVSLIILAVLFIIKPIITFQILIGILSFIYFVDCLFSLFLILKSLYRPKEITFTQSELGSLSYRSLKTYSILCPLYKESHIIPQFIESINKLDYPKEKLEVILLLEEDDVKSINTVANMTFPPHVKILVVPHAYPKTKPKACNYGLAHASGEYIVIYDAEDIPDPLQLKKAVLGFQKSDDNVICLQAKLNYYNPGQNLLTRFFTAEYSLWFDLTLIGLQALGTAIPLGGTSNHFKTRNLHLLEGWDPFNVTEDADLGVRLFKKGYKTAILDSVTYEEANSKWGNWVRQRSRWIKGYMQTYLVHSRNHIELIKKTNWHTIIFHLIIGGKIAFILINPVLWLVTISYFALHSIVGSAIDSVYPAITLYMAIISLIFGNTMFLFYYMIGCAKKEYWGLIKYIFLIPLYWFMISVAGALAFYQLIFKPHYWEKTTHGLHLKQNTQTGFIIELESIPSFLRIPQVIRNLYLSVIQFKNLHFSNGKQEE